MKMCPICGSICFDDMDVCYGCLHDFSREPSRRSVGSLVFGAMPVGAADGAYLDGAADAAHPHGAVEVMCSDDASDVTLSSGAEDATRPNCVVKGAGSDGTIIEAGADGVTSGADLGVHAEGPDAGAGYRATNRGFSIVAQSDGKGGFAFPPLTVSFGINADGAPAASVVLGRGCCRGAVRPIHGSGCATTEKLA